MTDIQTDRLCHNKCRTHLASPNIWTVGGALGALYGDYAHISDATEGGVLTYYEWLSFGYRLLKVNTFKFKKKTAWNESGDVFA